MRSISTILVITILLGLLAAVGWFAWTKLSHKASVDPAATQAAFTQATSLAKKGQYDQAIAILQDVKPEDPQHDRAVSMIADLEQKKSQGAAMVDGKPAETYYQECLRRDKTMADGRHAFRRSRNFDHHIGSVDRGS